MRRSAPVGEPLGKRQRRGDVALRGLGDRLRDHPGAARELRAGVDQDEVAGALVLAVAVEHQRARGGDLDRADLVQHQGVVDLSGHVFDPCLSR
jgi:hypothetical protein